MKRLFKYQVPVSAGISLIPMPRGAKLVSAGFQEGHSPSSGPPQIVVQVWAVVDPDAPLVDRALAAIGTGWEIPDGDGHNPEPVYVGMVMAGQLVWHVLDFGEV